MAHVARPRSGFCAGLLLVVLATGCSPKTPELPPPPKPQAKHPVVAFTYSDQFKQPFGLEDLKGKVWVATFIFINCSGPCPDMTRAMQAIQRETPGLDDLHLVTFTWEPQNDTAEALHAYGKTYRANFDRWHFLRGPDEKAVSDLQEKGFLMGARDHHATYFTLVDQQGRVRRWYDARRDEERERLILDARALLAGKALGS